MNIYVITASGFYTTGTAVVAHDDAEKATAMANEASEYHTAGRDFGGAMTYFSLNAKMVGTAHCTKPQILSLHEWGMPELPSRGSGKQVTF